MEPAEIAVSQNRACSNISFDDESELLDDGIDKINQWEEQETFEEALAQIFKGNYLQLDKNEGTLISTRRRKLWRDVAVKLSKLQMRTYQSHYLLTSLEKMLQIVVV